MAEWAHDLRSPLTVAKGHLYLLGRRLNEQGVVSEAFEAEVNEGLRNIEWSLQRCAEMTELVGLSAHDAQEEMERLSLKELVREMIQAFSAWAENRGVKIWAAMGSEDFPIRGVRTLIMRAAQNVLINAVEACEGRPGEVGVLLKRDGDLAALQVLDNGCGMSLEIQRHAFDPYFTQGKPEGRGLGMSIMQRIVLQHGGCVELASQVGLGTSVVLRFPICPNGYM